MSITAFAVTAGSGTGGDPGITVRDDDPAVMDLAVLDGDPGDSRGDLDWDAADAMLRAAGWARTGPWIRSGEQWAAHVERA